MLGDRFGVAPAERIDIALRCLANRILVGSLQYADRRGQDRACHDEA